MRLSIILAPIRRVLFWRWTLRSVLLLAGILLGSVGTHLYQQEWGTEKLPASKENARGGGVVAKLMKRPVSMFDFGMHRVNTEISQTLEGMLIVMGEDSPGMPRNALVEFKEACLNGSSHLEASIDYDQKTNRLTVRAELFQVVGNAKDAQATASLLVRAVRRHFRTMPLQHYFSSPYMAADSLSADFKKELNSLIQIETLALFTEGTPEKAASIVCSGQLGDDTTTCFQRD